MDRPILFKNARLIDPSRNLDSHGDLLVGGGKILSSTNTLPSPPEGSEVIDCTGLVLSPGLVDMQVFVGEPGAEHRETLASASRAAAAGGVTTMICMPDTEPVIDDVALVDFILTRARDTAVVNVRPMAAMTYGLNGKQMTEFGLMMESGAVGLTNGRQSVSNTRVMQRALIYAHNFDALIQHHCEDQYLACGGVMNEGAVATRLGLPGIPCEAESIILARDTQLALLTGSRYHAAQISCRSSATIVEQAKQNCTNISCGVSVNHLTLNENDIGSYRTFFKTSPPLRSEEERKAMVHAIRTGVIDVIVSSHDPQHVETKRLPFSKAANGTIGLETLLSASLRLFHSENVSLLRILHALSTRPAELLKLECGSLREGAPADLVLFDLDEPWILEKDSIISRSKNTPYESTPFQGCVKRTFVAGKMVYKRESIEASCKQ